MTRWARHNQSHNSKAEESTPWNEMRKSDESDMQSNKESDDSKKEKRLKKGFKNLNKKKFNKNGSGVKKSDSIDTSLMDELNDRNPVTKERHFVKKNKNGYIDLEPEVENRLQQLKKDLWKKGVSGEEIRQVIRKERRHAEIQRKREIKRRCFNCRKPGHNLADCPSASSSVDYATGLCFKCGSTEHDVSTCSIKKNEFPYAKCFICGEQGHLSRNCPDNPRGLYPNGGGCKICGSVEHFKKDCPEHQEKANEVFVERIDSTNSADAENSTHKTKPSMTKKKVTVVKF